MYDAILFIEFRIQKIVKILDNRVKNVASVTMQIKGKLILHNIQYAILFTPNVLYLN